MSHASLTNFHHQTGINFEYLKIKITGHIFSITDQKIN